MLKTKQFWVPGTSRLEVHKTFNSLNVLSTMVALLSDFWWHEWFKECLRFPQHLTSSLIVGWEHGPAAKELVKLQIKLSNKIGTQQTSSIDKSVKIVSWFKGAFALGFRDPSVGSCNTILVTLKT